MSAANAKDPDAIMKNYLGGEGLFVFDVIPPRQYVGADAFHKGKLPARDSKKRELEMTLNNRDRRNRSVSARSGLTASTSCVKSRHMVTP